MRGQNVRCNKRFIEPVATDEKLWPAALLVHLHGQRRWEIERSLECSLRALHLSEGTVRNYLSTAIAKTGARNRVEAARLAAEQGWL